MKENYGDLEELKEKGKNKKYSYTIEQIIDPELKCKNGENMNNVKKRMEKCIEYIIKNNEEKKVAIISHGAAIKFFIMNWCNLVDDKIYYKDTLINIECLSTLKLEFEEDKLIDLKLIK